MTRLLKKVTRTSRGAGPRSKTKKKVVTTLVTKRSVKRSSRRAMKGPGLDPVLLRCLANPFDEKAVGAKWPSSDLMDTSTARLFKVCTLTSDNAGSISCTVIPDPMVSLWVRAGQFAGLPGYTGSPNWGGVANRTGGGLPNIASAYRVVGFGIRMRNLIAPLSATGKLVLCPLPIPGRLPNPALLETYIADDNSSADQIFNQGSSSAMSTANYAMYPRAQTVTVSDLLSGTELLSVLRPSNEGCVAWKPCWVPSNDDGSFQTSGVARAFGTVLASGASAPFDLTRAVDPFWGDFRHASALNIQATGLPVSTACFEFDFIIHLEYCPKMSGVEYVSTSVPRPVPGTPEEYIDSFENVSESWVDWSARSLGRVMGGLESAKHSFDVGRVAGFGGMFYGGGPGRLPLGAGPFMPLGY